MAAKTTATTVAATSVAHNTPIATTFVTAVNTGTTSTDTEFFEITVSKAEPRGVILIQNFSTVSTSTVRYTVVAPTGTSKYWAAGSDTTEASIAGALASGANQVSINIEGAKYTNTSGKIRVNVALSTAGVTTGGLAAVCKIAYVQLI
jgi:hypothetical protein